MEGTLDPVEMIEEGPVSEFSGLYERYGPGRRSSRSTTSPGGADALFQVVEPGLAAERVG